MGVPGLWDLLRPAATRTSLSTLAKSAFHANQHGLRALTIGVDASLWIFHAQIPTAGENPFLRTIFFKICTLLQQPILPVFVFDGPNKPNYKRGQRVAGQFGTADRRSLEFKALLNECGLEWWNAPGEAEAELAVMNRQGKIDAVLSDDVDALLFGATCLLRNNSPTLSGTQASQHASSSTASAKADLRSYEVYRSSAVHATWSSKANSQLATEEDCRMAMIFVALLAGGDYVPEGLEAFGPTIAFALAQAGMAEYLPLFVSDTSGFNALTSDIQANIVDELRTNASGHIGRRYPDRASKLVKRDPAELFPASALRSYLQPATSSLLDHSAGWPGFGQGESSRSRGKARNGGRGDLEGMAQACEKYFEWGTRELVAKKFASESVGVFGADIMNSARLCSIDRDRRGRSSSPRLTSSNAQPRPATQSRMTSFFGSTIPSFASTAQRKQDPSSSPSRRPEASMPIYIHRIERTRPDPTNVELTEYRILYDTQQLRKRAHDAMRGTRVDPKYLTAEERLALGMIEAEAVEDDLGEGLIEKADKGQARVWLADWLVKAAWPELAQDWEDRQAAKASKATGKGRSKLAASVKKIPVKKAVQKRTDGEDPGKFATYFGASQAPRRSPGISSRQWSADAARRAERVESEEEIEVVESSPRPRSPTARPAKSRTRSSSRDPDLLVPPSRLKSTTASPGPHTRAGRMSARSKSPRAARPESPRGLQARRKAVPIISTAKPSGEKRITRSASGQLNKPIEILSSDEERSAPVAPVRRSPPGETVRRGNSKAADKSVLGSSSRQNTLSPRSPKMTSNAPSSKIGTSRIEEPRSKSSFSTQARLTTMMPIVSASVQRPASSKSSADAQGVRGTSITAAIDLIITGDPPSPGKSRSAVRASPSPLPPMMNAKKGKNKSRRSYVVLQEPGDGVMEIIDCTRGGRRLIDRRSEVYRAHI